MATEVAFSKLQSMITKNEVLVIDVRSPEDIKGEGAFPNSINIPADNVDAAFKMTDDEFAKKYCVIRPDKQCCIVFVDNCKGKDAEKAAQQAIDAGFTKARIYRGGIDEWAAKGGEVKDSC